MYIDALGKACPTPVILTKKELDAGARDITVAVDNKIATENLTRLAESYSMKATVSENGAAFLVRISGEGKLPEKAFAPSCSTGATAGANYSVFICRERVGDGDSELGSALMKMAIYTLSESDELPKAVLFMNGGVKLLTGDEEQIISSVKSMAERGVDILVCGTCLNFYGLTEKLKAGKVSNMYDILTAMRTSSNTITL